MWQIHKLFSAKNCSHEVWVVNNSRVCSYAAASSCMWSMTLDVCTSGFVFTEYFLDVLCSLVVVFLYILFCFCCIYDVHFFYGRVLLSACAMPFSVRHILLEKLYILLEKLIALIWICSIIGSSNSIERDFVIICFWGGEGPPPIKMEEKKKPLHASDVNTSLCWNLRFDCGIQQFSVMRAFQVLYFWVAIFFSLKGNITVQNT